MSNKLEGKRVAVLATDGVEQIELTAPVTALRSAGASVDVIGPEAGQLQGYKGHDKGDMIAVDRTLQSAKAGEYEALVLPGGVANPDALRINSAAIDFIRHFVAAKKPIAAICHGPWTLINADGVRGKRMTSWPSLEADLRNAGANWVDEAVVVDGQLVTSRKPDDLPQFCNAIIDKIQNE